MAELVDARDSKSRFFTEVRVRFPLRAPQTHSRLLPNFPSAEAYYPHFCDPSSDWSHHYFSRGSLCFNIRERVDKNCDSLDSKSSPTILSLEHRICLSLELCRVFSCPWGTITRTKHHDHHRRYIRTQSYIYDHHCLHRRCDHREWCRVYHREAVVTRAPQ